MSRSRDHGRVLVIPQIDVDFVQGRDQGQVCDRGSGRVRIDLGRDLQKLFGIYKGLQQCQWLFLQSCCVVRLQRQTAVTLFAESVREIVYLQLECALDQFSRLICVVLPIRFPRVAPSNPEPRQRFHG